MDLSLASKRALVCGASRGIGRATARALAELGASVFVMARDRDALKATVESLNAQDNQQHGLVVADAAVQASLETAIAELSADAKPIQILVNNSGGPAPGPANEAAAEQFVAAFHQHVVANHILLTAFLPRMKETGYGRVINIISTSVKEPIKGLGVSNTIRAAVASWAKTLASELGPFGITVNNVLPGFTGTERLTQIFKTRAARAGRPVDEIEQAARNAVPLGRFAEPGEIANAVAFLASPAAAYISGINLPVDGGRTSSL